MLKFSQSKALSVYSPVRRKMSHKFTLFRVHIKEKFLSDLRQARETYSGEELRNILHSMSKRLDDIRLLSGEVIFNILMSFRDIQASYFVK